MKYVKGIKEFEVVIFKPEFTICDKISPLQNKTIGVVNFSLNFISVMGFDTHLIDIEYNFKWMVSDKFYEFINIIFNSNKIGPVIDEYFNKLN